MHRRILSPASACLLAASLSPAFAQQQQQTAAGAQKFLGMLAEDGALFVQALDKTTNAMSLRGTKTYVRRWLKNGVEQKDGPYGDASEAVTINLQQMLGVVKAEGVDARGNTDPCTTRLETATTEKPDKVSVSEHNGSKETFFGYDDMRFRSTETARYEDPNVKYAGPYYAAWGKATISRSTGLVVASLQDSRFNAYLYFKAKDTDMADRVEYAMKFLKASCDKTAATGF